MASFLALGTATGMHRVSIQNAGCLPTTGEDLEQRSFKRWSWQDGRAFSVGLPRPCAQTWEMAMKSREWEL